MVIYAQMLVTDDCNNYRVANGQVQRGNHCSAGSTKDELPLHTPKAQRENPRHCDKSAEERLMQALEYQCEH